MNINESLEQVHAIRAQMETEPQFKAAMLKGMSELPNIQPLPPKSRRPLYLSVMGWGLLLPRALLFLILWALIALAGVIQVGLRCLYFLCIFMGLFYLGFIAIAIFLGHVPSASPQLAIIWRVVAQSGLATVVCFSLDLFLFLGQGFAIDRMSLRK